MGRIKARMKNVVISGIICSCVVLFWIHGFKNDGNYQRILDDQYMNLRDELQRSELTNKQKMNELQILRSQFNILAQAMSQNSTNGTYTGDFHSLMRNDRNNITDQLGSLHLPSIFTYLPHLTGQRESMKPVYKLSRNRYGTSVVMGIPTIRRDKVDYLKDTVKSLIEGMTQEEKDMCLIIVFVAEPWDIAYAKEVGDKLYKEFTDSVEAGLLEVIAPPAGFYPDMDNLKLTFGDTKDRVRWRTKQNLDFSFLMLYARLRGFYYVQLEDDIVAKPGYFSIMKTYSDQQETDEWLVLEFSTLGFIGKLFKASQIPVIVEFFLMFHRDKPIDWLLDHFLTVKVCSPEKDTKHCDRMKSEVRKRFKPSLFQHVGTQSSLKGKTQKLKDKNFGKQAIYRAHVNPPATIQSSMKAYQKYFLNKAYIGEDVFWGLTPAAGDTIEFKFNPFIEIASFLFRTGNVNHPTDKLTNTDVEILPEGSESDYKKVGEFDQEGLASAELAADLGKVKALRIRVLKELETWVLISEIHIVERKKGS